MPMIFFSDFFLGKMSRGGQPGDRAGPWRDDTPGSGDVRNERHYEAIAYLITWLVGCLFGWLVI